MKNKLILLISLILLVTIVSAAAAGVPLHIESIPPMNVPVKAGYKYFLLDSECSLFKEASLGGGISIYTPQQIPELIMELIVTDKV